VTVVQVLLFFILVIGSYTSIVNHRFHLRASPQLKTSMPRQSASGGYLS